MKNTTLGKLEKKSRQYQDYETDKKITWCSNCGNYSIQNALKRALVLEGIKRNDFLLCYDVGCSGNGSDKIEANTIHGLHGRILGLAAGAGIANSKMKIIAEAGDGATFSEGVGHLVHSVRNNYPVMFIFHNNENYGLTTGQASALTRVGTKMNSAPEGVNIEPLNACDFVLSLKPSFVARSYSGDPDHITEMFRKGLKHNGFAFIEIFQACPTYNRETPDHWFAQRIKYVEDLKGYDKNDIWQARKTIQDLENEIYIGHIYEDKNRKSFMDVQENRKSAKTVLRDEVKHYNINNLI